MPDLPAGSVAINLTQPKAQQFTYGFYGPGTPQAPATQGQPTRQWDYPSGVNTTYTPRHTEPFTFRHLRAFANVELVRMAIETRKDQLERLDWMVRPKEGKKGRSKERDPRCIEVEKFLNRPNGADYFGEFFRALDEDLLALDAPCMERLRTRGGKLRGLEYVDGSTINLLVDDTGRRPRGPDDLAFQQIAHGVLLKNLTNRDLIYLPRNVRSGHIYGFGAVEQIVVTINTIMRRQASQLAYFTEGNVPSGILNGPEGWQTEQLRDMQQWFDEQISGNAGAQRSIKWVPYGSKYQAFKDSPLKDDYDEWLARLVAFAFSLPPTPFIRQMNKGTAGEDQERALEEGLEPLKQWRKRLIDRLIEDEFGYTDLEFAFKIEREIDPKVQSDIDDKALRNGSAVIDEVRETRGQDPLPDGMGAKPLIYTSTGVVPLEEALKPAPAPLMEPPVPAHDGDPALDPNATEAPAPAPPGSKKKSSAEKLSKAHKPLPDQALALSVDRPKAIEVAAALQKRIAPILAKAGKSAAKQVSDALGKAERDPKIVAKEIVTRLDLSALLDLLKPIEEELEDIGLDAVDVAAVSIGVADASELVNRVNPRAVAYAKQRAAELVSLDGDESLIASTRNMLQGVISNGLADNIGRDAIAEQIQQSTAFSEARSTLIANTEIAEANSVAKKETWDTVHADGAAMVKQWFCSEDEGTCDECLGNEDQGEIPYEDEFDSGDDMEPGHPGCLTGDSLVLALGVSAASQRWYDGDIVVLGTAGGQELSCTPNHPILTPRGWVAAGLLDEGDHVIGCRFGDRDSLGRLDHQNMPARIEDVAEALRRSEQVAAVPVPVSAEDFHGDGKGSEVAVILADRRLWCRRDPASGEHVGELDLTLIDVGLTDHARDCDLPALLKSVSSTARSDMSGRDLALALLGGHAGPLEALGVGLAASGDTLLAKNPRHDESLDAEPLSDGVLTFATGIGRNDRDAIDRDPPSAICLDAASPEEALQLNAGEADLDGERGSAFASPITLSQIVDVKRQRFCGHVYNLQTEDGYYIADGIVTHNCRCVTTARVLDPGESAD